MSLKKYIEKRNFERTSEPKSGRKTTKGQLRFVVQRHHASHLHYDFRLEMDGVLKSWAVPKGPSLNPKDKRLAMMVEDHPYSYRTFEGIIPEGNYGAGVVSIFDEGTYEPLDKKAGEKELRRELYSGNLKFRLHGHILKGEFALVKLKSAEDNAWLLIKHNDEYAVNGNFNSEDLVPESVKKKGIERKKASATKSRRLSEAVAELPEKEPPNEDFSPMLAKLSDHVFDDANWIYERKLDGYRVLLYSGTNPRIISRKGIDYSKKYKPVMQALEQIQEEAVIDGEVVAEDRQQKSYFQNLQNYEQNKKAFTLKCYAFDLLALNGHDLRDMPLIQRKELLKTLLSGYADPAIVYLDHVKEKGKKLFADASSKGWEGIIAKNAQSIYLSGKRSDNWQKFKLQNSQEAIIIGYTKPEGSRHYFGSLVLGMYDKNELVYIGNCGTGFDSTSLKDVYARMQKLRSNHKPVSQKVHREKDATWLKPELVCEVMYSEWTADKHLRHPVFKGLRNDKSREEVVQELPADNSKNHIMEDTREEKIGNKKLKLTHLNKLYWEKEHISKGQLIDYYRNISAYILPWLKDRPLSLNRHPNGINGPSFFQKDLDTDQVPGWIKSVPIYSESNDKDIDYLICNDLATLLWMVNLGCIEINPWLSTYKKPENPVFAVMDLDPNNVPDFTQVIDVALAIKDILTGMGIKPYIKTSGSRGLHIFIHVGARYDYDTTKSFIQYIGQLVHDQFPDITSLERSPSKRKNKIYLDFLQNRRGQTIAAPYSVRPKPGATVSAPLSWDEVNHDLKISDYTLFNIADRLKEKGELWTSIFDEKADLKQALKRSRELKAEK